MYIQHGDWVIIGECKIPFDKESEFNIKRILQKSDKF